MAQPRAGNTVKVSVSLAKEDIAALKRYARHAHGGNLSAAFGDAARWIRQQEARRRLIDKLGGPSLTVAAAKAIDLEQAGGLGAPRKPRRRRAA